VIARRSVEPRLRGLVILVVEDHTDSRELLSQLLLHEHATVLTAFDGRAALAMLEARTPDLILADLRMPGMGGLAFARCVKADARWARVPIIAITGSGNSADLQATFEAGFAAHVMKPIEWDSLMHTIERVLPAARSRAPRSRRPRRRS
jgi:two-component system CheB/CheR fusion protein